MKHAFEQTNFAPISHDAFLSVNGSIEQTTNETHGAPSITVAQETCVDDNGDHGENSVRICRVHCKINRLTNFGSLNYWLEVAFMKYNNNNNNNLCKDRGAHFGLGGL